MESNCSMIEKMPPKGESFSDFICTFATSLMILLVVKRITKVSEKSDMAKSWALGFAACHKQELFVAQELMNNIKLNYCGI